MKAQLIIEKGQARLLRPIYLKPSAPTHFEIDIPEEAVAAPRDWFADEPSSAATQSAKPVARPDSLQEELNEILGPLARVRSGASIGDDHQMLLDAMEERQVGL